MDERVWIVLGVVLVVIGVMCAIYAGPMEMQAERTYAGGDIGGGDSLRMQADAFRYGGLGIAALGLMLMAGSWVKYVMETAKRI